MSICQWPNPRWIASRLQWPCRASTAYVIVACGSFNPPTIFHMHIMEHARDFLRSMDMTVLGGLMSPVHDDYRTRKPSLISSKHRVEMVRRALSRSDWIQLDDWETRQQGYTRTLVALTEIEKRINHALKLTYDLASWPPSSLNTIQSFSTYTKSALSSGEITAEDLQDALGLDTKTVSDFIQDQMNASANDALLDKLRVFQSKASSCLAGSLQMPPKVHVAFNCGEDLLMSMLQPGVWLEAQLHSLLSQFPIICLERESQTNSTAEGCESASGLATAIAKSPILSLYAKTIWTTRTEVVNNMSSSLIRNRISSGRSVQYLVPDDVYVYLTQETPYTSPSESS